MTRTSRDPETVHLAASNWLALATLLALLVGAAWKFTLDISGELASVRMQVSGFERRLDRLDRLDK